MISFQLLESNDIIDKNDWVRRLYIPINDGWGPENPVDKAIGWLQAKYVFGACWSGCTVGEIAERLRPYEFVRGDMPKSHQYPKKCQLVWDDTPEPKYRSVDYYD